MKIGNFEIRRFKGVGRWIEDWELPMFHMEQKDLSGVFAVSGQEPWWLAVMQVLDQYEKEIIKGAYEVSANTNMCINAIGNAEGVKLVRERLIALREEALGKKVA